MFKVNTILFTTILFFAGSFLSLSQPFAIGHVSMTLTDASRNNRQITTEIYYPALTAGDNVEISAAGPFPVVAFGHGFVMGFDAYQNIWSALVPQGFIVVLPTTEGGFAPSHTNFGKDLAFIIEELELMGTSTTSMFYEQVSSQSAVMGHSMGGGAAFLAATETDAIEAIATLAPANTNPSAIAAAQTLSIPALVIAGANDCVTPPDVHQLPMYNGLVSACKTYISITGGSHCQMAQNNTLCNIGEFTCSPTAAISREAQHLIINNYLVNWLKATLQGNCVAGSAFNNLIAADAAITFQKTCDQCELLDINDSKDKSGFIVPNPFSDTLTYKSEMDIDTHIFLYDVQGRMVLNFKAHTETSVDTTTLIPGMYFYKIKGSESEYFGKLIKH